MKTCKQLGLVLLGLLFLLVLIQPGAAHANSPSAPRLPGDSDWDGRFGGPPGVDGSVHALAVNSKTGEVYVGGQFHWAGGVAVNNIAKYNPATHSWSALGSGFIGPSAEVDALAVTSSGTVYAGGRFLKAWGNPASYLAKWNGNSWSSVGGGVDSGVNAMAVSGRKLYVGGYFKTAGGKTVNALAVWDETKGSWAGVGHGVDGYIYALAMSGSTLYAGGHFTKAGGVVTNNLAKWNGSTWSALGGGVSAAPYDTSVNAIAVNGNDLYVAGFFTQAGSLPANDFARWNGSAWSAPSISFDLGSNDWLSVNAVASIGSTVYVAGNFAFSAINPDHTPVVAQNIVGWNPATGYWSNVGDVNGNTLTALAVGGKLFVGGGFTLAGSVNTGGIAAWDGAQWSAFGTNVSQSVDGPITALAVDGSDVYVGGRFDRAGTVTVHNLARWNRATNTWSDVGGGVTLTPCEDCNVAVNTLAVSNGKIYVGGTFDHAGAVPVHNLAAWDGSNWSALGAPALNTVHALALDAAGNLYVGASYALEKWDGANWTELGEAGGTWALPGVIYAIAIDGSEVYVSGFFTGIGNGTTGTQSASVARWDSANGWSGLGSGLMMDDGLGIPGTGLALGVQGGNVYVGGNFVQAEGTPVTNIARWDGNSWSALGDGIASSSVQPYVKAIAFVGSNLFAAGIFDHAGLSAANNIAAWDGGKWIPLGSGVETLLGVNALAANGTDLLVGGDFTTAGAKWSNYFARFDAAPSLPPPPLVTLEESDPAMQYDSWRPFMDWWNNRTVSRMSNHAGDTVQFTFTGTSVSWGTEDGPDQGKAQVTIDGANKGTFDLYADNPGSMLQPFSGLTNTSHRMVIRVLGTANDMSSDTNVVVNSFTVGQKEIDSGNPAIQYNKWTGTTNTKASGKAYRVSQTGGETATFTFRGTGVSWVTAKGPGYGQAEVFLDGVDKGKVDLYAATAQWQVLLSYLGLSEGQHTLEIRVLGAKRAASSGTKVVVDAFQVKP